MTQYTEFKSHLSKNDQLISRKGRMFLMTFISLFLFSINVMGQTTPVTFSFTLSAASKTSAGVYNSSGKLIRTLWSGVSYSAGTFSSVWDKKDEQGNVLTGLDFTIKVVSNNVTYEWDGVVGNTSTSKTGNSKIRHLRSVCDLSIASGKGFYCTGFVEGNSSANMFSLTSIQTKTEVTPAQNGDINLELNYNCTDGNYVYWSGFDAYGSNSFTYATKVSDASEVLFSSGSSASTTYGRTYPKAIDILSGKSSNPSGIAVQKTGNYLFISHAGLNKIHIFNKSTGASVGTFSITSPGDVATDDNNNLWVITGTSVSKYTVSNAGALTYSSAITGFGNPISLSGYDTLMAILDAGSSQIKTYSTKNNKLAWTLGQANGYASSAEVKNDKFYFWDNNMNEVKGFVSFGTDGSIWVGDAGNNRIQHFSASRTYLENIMYMPMSYSSSVNITDPTRVFSDFLEFKVDYSKTLGGTNGSWILVNNWKPGLNSNYYKSNSDTREVFKNCVTLSNGKTYGTILYTDPNTEIRYPEVVELVSGGKLRLTGIRLGQFSNNTIDADGTLRYFSNNTWYERTLTGFTNTGNPIWANAASVGTAPGDNDSPVKGSISNPEKTSSNMLILFDKSYSHEGYHLAAVKKGESTYAWKASPSTTRTYTGAFPTDGKFDVGNGVEYAGGQVFASDRNIFWNYIGEFWKNSQTNKWNHYYDNGLFISQFGITTPDAEKMDGINSPRMAAGNAFSGGMVKVGNDYYIYHCDESVHGGVHRWKISNLSSIAEQVINLGSNNTPTVAEIDIKGNSVSISKGSTSISSNNNTDFGTVDTGKNVTKTYVIENSGTAALSITGITISGTNASDFSIVSQPSFPLSIAVSSSYTLTVKFAPKVSGSKSAKITVVNTDIDEASYDFAIGGTSQTITGVPVIQVSGNGKGIVDGDMDPTVDDNTDFGSINVGGSINKTFIIYNTGYAALSVSKINITGTDASMFNLVNPPSFPLSIAASGSYTFTVQFKPTDADIKYAGIEILSDDSKIPTYDFVIVGFANSQSNPTIVVKGGGVQIADGDNTPSTSDNTDFGSINVGGSINKTFIIYNTGTAALNVSKINITGTDAAMFKLVNPPTFPLNIAASGSYTITVQFKPTLEDIKYAGIEILSDDSKTSAYDFVIVGFANPQAKPKIVIKGGGIEITDGDITPSTSDNTDFGSIIKGQSTSKTFVISNTGSASLSISSIKIGGTNVSEFTITGSPKLPLILSAGTSYTVTVLFAPAATGIRYANMEVISNDPAIGTYDFNIQGTGTVSSTSKWKTISTSYTAYPNPTSGKFRLSSKRSMTGDFIIFNPLGQNIYSGSLGEEEIDLSGHARGIYMIIINTEEGTEVVRVSLEP